MSFLEKKYTMLYNFLNVILNPSYLGYIHMDCSADLLKSKIDTTT